MMERLGFLSMLLLASLIAPARAGDVTGTWRVTISTSEGGITGKASDRRSPIHENPHAANAILVHRTRITGETRDAKFVAARRTIRRPAASGCRPGFKFCGS